MVTNFRGCFFVAFCMVLAAANAPKRAVMQFFEDWHNLLLSYPDTSRLTACLQDQVNLRSTWARAFLGNVQLMVHAVTA